VVVVDGRPGAATTSRGAYGEVKKSTAAAAAIPMTTVVDDAYDNGLTPPSSPQREG
jgi:hypothetical protein